MIGTSHPRRRDAIFDGIAGVVYLALFIVSAILANSARGGVLAIDAALVAR